MKVSRRDFVHAGCVLAAVTLSPPFVDRAEAVLHRSFGGPTGTAILNGFENFFGAAFPFKNLLLGAPQPTNASGTSAFPAWLDANGYPTANPGGRANGILCGQVPVPASWNGNYIFGWTGKGQFGLDRGAPGWTIISGGGFVSGGTGFSITAVGTSGRIVFAPTGGGSTVTNIPFSFATNIASAFDGTLSGAYLCRDNGTDEADILSGDLSRMFNNDFIAAVQTLNPWALRVMDFVNTNNSNVTQPYALRRPLASFSFGALTTTGVGSHWPPSLWAGAISGADTYTCGAAPSTPGVWTHGEQFQGQFGASAGNTVWTYSAIASNGGICRLTVPSTTGLSTGQKVAVSAAGNANGNWIITVVDGTHIDLTTNLKTGLASVFDATGSGSFSTATINVNSRGAKLLIWGANGGGSPLINGGVVTNNDIATFSYDADFDAVYYTPGNGTPAGLTSGPPIEVVVALANKLHMGLWLTFPHLITNADVISLASYVSNTLFAASPAYFEWSNEVWNGQFGQSGVATAKGLLLSNGTAFVASSHRAQFGYYALRCVQVMNLVKTAMPRAKRVIATQAFGGGGLSQPVNVYRFKGTDLTPSGNSVYSGSSISGGVDYTAAPNRPIDVATDIAYATYYSGAQCANADANYTSLAGITGGSNLLGQAANFVAGGSTNIANALAFLDNDIRQGTLNAVAGQQTLLALDTGDTGSGAPNGIYPPWENVAASYDASRNSNGLPLLQVSCYEGACEIWPVTAGRLAALGDGSSTTNAANVAALITGYKNSALFKQLVLDQFNQMMGTFATSANFGLLPHSKHPCWYQFSGNSQWSLYQGDIYSTTWQSYAAFRQYNGH